MFVPPMSKVALIGLDAAVPSLVRRFFNRGVLPNLSRLASDGVLAECIPVFPTHTASNWNTVSTGSWPKTHGVTDMVVHIPGDPLTEVTSGFYSNLCRSEQIWNTAETAGKRVILMKYIGSWPPTLKNGIQIEGFGAPGGPASRPWGSSPLSIANSSCYCTTLLPNATFLDFSDASPSQENENLPRSHLPAKRAQIKVTENGPIFYIFALATTPDAEYDTLVIAPSNNPSAFFHLRKGQYSDWLVDEFQVDGSKIRGSFRMKLMDIGGRSSTTVKLFLSQIFPTEGWTFPAHMSSELISNCGYFLESISHFPCVFGWIDEQTYLNDAKYQADWLGKATKYLMSKYEWDLYMMQWHGIDNTQHAFLRFDKSALTPEEAVLCDSVVQKSYQIADYLVGEIVEATRSTLVGSNKTDINIIAMSDHGHVMGKRRFFINAYLYEKGFISLKRHPVSKKITVDWGKTKAFVQGMVHLYVNLKGREPEGCVSPGKEYEDALDDLINVLYDVKDPINGFRPIALALRNKESEFIGLSGDRVGDIVFAAHPLYAIDNRVRINEELFENLKTLYPDGSIHGAQLPSVDLGENGTTNALFIAQGPRIKKGYVREKPINIVDIAPTITHILDIPPPKHCEGRVMYDILE